MRCIVAGHVIPAVPDASLAKDWISSSSEASEAEELTQVHEKLAGASAQHQDLRFRMDRAQLQLKPKWVRGVREFAAVQSVHDF